MTDRTDDTEPGNPASSAPAADPPSGSRLGRYVVIGPAGKGGQAVVLLAYDPQLDRRVALKLLPLGKLSEAGHQRLQREAQALARLSHPNVVPVYDVGSAGESAFVAMEYVEGVTLEQWLQTTPPLAEVLARLRDAGRGLAAAHDAGLVHRDFKPGNVIIGRDGRVRVVDFGLARSVDDAPEQTTSDSGHATHRRLSQVTRDDHIVGTPAFMAPEQLEQGTCDARADQYSFGVTLRLALRGRLPTAERDTEAESTADERPAGPGRTPADATDRGVPAWLERIVQRTLRANPDERYPSMHALLDALERDPVAARRRWARVAALLGLLAAAGTVAVAAQRQARLRCRGGSERIATAWSPGAAARLRQAFAASGLPYAPALADALVHQLDDYARRWAAMADDACVATHVRGEQSEEALDLRGACLEHRRAELSALANALGHADVATVRHGGEALQALGGLEACADVRSLRAEQPRPRDAAQASRLDALEAGVAEVQARYAVGAAQAGAALAESMLPDAKAVGYLPVVANLEHWLARCRSDLHDEAGAVTHFTSAFSAALQAHADHLAAQVAVRLAQEHLFSSDAGHAARYEQWASIGAALIARVGGDVNAELILARVRCSSMFDSGQIRARLRCIDGVVRQAEEAGHLTEWDVSMLGLAHVDVGQLDEGVRWLERGVDLSRRQLGPNHPRTLENRGFPCFAYDERGDAERAAATCESALDDARKNAPEQGFLRARLSLYLAQAQRWLGRFDAAEVNARAAAREEELKADAELELGLIADGRGRSGDALAHARAALAMNLQTLPDSHPNVILARVALGEALLHAGELEAARGMLTQAEQTAVVTEMSPLSEAVLRFALARALAPTDSRRAAMLADQARAAYDAAPRTPRYQQRRSEILRFVAALPAHP